MAVETSLTRVSVTVHPTVVIVDLVLVIVFVAVYARKGRVVATCVAFNTCVPFTIVPAAVDREVVSIVVKSGWVPSVGIMAHGTVRWEQCRGMAWVIGAVVVRHVAGITVRRCAGVSIGMAGNTTHAYVRPNKREVGRIMIIRSWGPIGYIVANGAIRWESSCYVVRVGRSIVIRDMASIAIRWGSLISIAMTGHATRSHMRAGQWEVGRVMIKCGIGPKRWVMADRAIGRESRRNMVRIRCTCVLRHVTTITRVRRVVVVPVVALVATHRSVCVRKRIYRMVIAAR